MWWVVFFVVALAALGSTVESPGYRLPPNLLPTQYVVEIITNLDEGAFNFSGKVWIKMVCTKATNTVILHSNKLTIENKEVTLKEIDGDEEIPMTLSGHRLVPENEFYLFKTDNLKAGKEYTLYIPFEGVLTEGLSGFYRSSYLDSGTNTTKWLAVTQFESTDARRAFPCFDEPAMKARFSISLGRRENFKSTSNMPIQKTEPIQDMKGWEWDRYEDTVPMSTYLVAFLVSEFDYREADKMANNVTFRIWARKDAIPQVEFAKKVGPNVLAYYEEYFGVKYPLPKQDMVAIPDFSAGAMENWGLITYRETALLFLNGSSSSVNQHGIASVIAHELAHQWFGNLVTMQWWTDLWLNEGFATYVAALGVHHEYPDWNSLDATNLENVQLVFTLDSLNSSHPVSIKIGHPSEIGQIFDTISYKKGAVLLRMMNLFMGEGPFRSGVTEYLKEHRFSNAEQDDLWRSLSAAAHKASTLPQSVTVKEIMDTWTVQTGYPLVTVTRNYQDGTATLTQRRYLQLPVSKGDTGKEPCWWIPITYTTQEKMDFQPSIPNLWMNCEENMTITVNGLPKDDQWVIFNIAGAGLYRVQYDNNNWMLIADTLNKGDLSKIGGMDRAHLMMNALDLAWRGDLQYDTALSMAMYLKREKSFIPWKAGLLALSNIDRLLRRSAIYGHFKTFLKDIIRPSYGMFGKMTNIPTMFEDVKHHATIMNYACRFDVGDCRSQVKELFKQWQQSTDPEKQNPVPSDMKSVVYCNAVRAGGEDVWNFMWDRYLKSNVGNEKNTILNALGCSRDIWILNRYLEWSIDENSGIRKQDSLTVFSSVARQELGFYVGRDFLNKRIYEIFKFHGTTNSKQGRYLSIFGDQITNKEEKDEWETFLKEHKDLLKYTHLIAKQSLETATANAHWTSEYYDKIVEVLQGL